MLRRLTLFLFPLTIFTNINTSLADSEKDFDFGFIFGAVSITCEMAVDYAKDSLDQDYFESFTENAYDNEDCIKFLP